MIQSAEPEPGAPGPIRPGAARPGARILVVDDEPLIRSHLQTLLRGEGHDVATAPDALHAVDRLANESFELLVTDLRMPGGMDGLELAERARSMDPTIGVIVVTGYASVGSAIEAIRRGVDDYVTKPFSIDELRARIDRIIATRRLHQERDRLVVELRETNLELERHKALLARRVDDTAADLARTNDELTRRVRDLDLTSEIARTVARTADAGRLLPTCLDILASRLGIHAAAIDVPDADGLRRVASVGLLPPPRDLAGTILREGRVIDATATEIAWRIAREDRVYGALTVGGIESDAFAETDRRLIERVVADLGTALENAELTRRNQENVLHVVAALVETLEARDSYLRGHSIRVTECALATAAALGLPDEDTVRLEHASRLHDVGKIGIPDRIYLKPGRLDPEEFATIKTHPELGERVIRRLPFLRDVCPIIRHHHERWDGRGYPDGIRGDAIDALTAIVTLADSYDAMVVGRPYRAARSIDEALAEVERHTGTQFHPEIAPVFCRVVRERS